MLAEEYDEVTIAEKFRQEGRREGIREGRREERINTERERDRADRAEARIKELEAQLAAKN